MSIVDTVNSAVQRALDVAGQKYRAVITEQGDVISYLKYTVADLRAQVELLHEQVTEARQTGRTSSIITKDLMRLLNELVIKRDYIQAVKALREAMTTDDGHRIYNLQDAHGFIIYGLKELAEKAANQAVISPLLLEEIVSFIETGRRDQAIDVLRERSPYGLNAASLFVDQLADSVSRIKKDAISQKEKQTWEAVPGSNDEIYPTDLWRAEEPPATPATVDLEDPYRDLLELDALAERDEL